jgi:uncharacterized protein
VDIGGLASSETRVRPAGAAGGHVVKPHQWRRSKAGPYLRLLPRIKHLKGSWLHRWFGERLFGHEMWQPERYRFAAGTAVGVFFAMMPLPFQMLSAGFIAVLTRVNLPAAIVATWVSNPLTLPVLLYGQYRLGAFLMGRPAGGVPGGGLAEILAHAPLPVLAGSFVFGIVASLAAYPLALAGWDFVTVRLLHRQPVNTSRRRSADLPRAGNGDPRV